MIGPLDFWLWTAGAAVIVVGARVTDDSGPLVRAVDESEPHIRVTDDSAALVALTDAPEI